MIYYLTRMLFNTQASRAEYLQDIQDDRETPYLGAAMHHASTTNLGVWGDRDALKLDCARVLIGEMRHHLASVPTSAFNGEYCTDLLSAVLHNTSFVTTFDHARIDQENYIERAVASISEREPPNLVASGVPVDREALAQVIITELQLDV